MILLPFKNHHYGQLAMNRLLGERAKMELGGYINIFSHIFLLY